MLTRRFFLAGSGSALSLSVLGSASPVWAAAPPVFSDKGLAIRGYDPVAFFLTGGPVEGLADHEADWNGATWRFSSAAHRDAFTKTPAAYAPQYGGYCAWAVSRGYTASTVPQAWHIHEGRLFLNYSRTVRALWRRDVPGNVARGDANWPKVLSA
jgi:YHS domain-containing protein